MKKFALIGQGISHSLSPLLFNTLYRATKGYSYDLIDAPTLEKGLEILTGMGYSGANITAPFKEKILEKCIAADEASSSIGASNLVLNKKEGLYAYNTDHMGVSGPLLSRNTDNRSKVVVAGAGGAARAAVYALKQIGCEITIINRTWNKARRLAEETGCRAVETDNSNSVIKECNVLVYTATSLIKGIDTGILKKAIILEANYKDPVLQNIDCKEYISGKEWLIHQAIPSFKAMTCIAPAPDELFKIIDNR
jgi:3-dehydroquinate dehydratase/shikimate dehydrogenase